MTPAPLPPPSRREPNLHRKNAAEWVMFVVIYPFAWIVSRFRK